MRKTALFGAMVLIALAVVSASAMAGDADEQKLVVRAQRMLRQMSLERDAALAENARLKSEIEQMKGKLAGVKKSSEAALAKSREGITALNDDLRQTARRLQQTQSEKHQLQDMVDGQAELIQSCDAKNAELVEVNRELLDRYRKKGVFDALLQREPITGLKRVELENIVQDYQDRLDRLVIRKKESATTP